MMLRELLRECGYRVLEAASTDEAIAVLEKTAIPVDVVLSEIDIAGSMNGVGFAQWARSVRPELQILLAGTPEHTVRNAAELCEAGPMLRKPYEHKLVLDRIKRLLWLARSSGAGVDPSIGRICDPAPDPSRKKAHGRQRASAMN